MAFPNKYPSLCATCKIEVGIGKGLCDKIKGKWTTYCKTCAALTGFIEVATAVLTETRRLLEADGSVILPFEPTALPLLRAMPGARWNPAKKCWSCSILPADLPRVIDIATTLKLNIAPELLAKATITEAAARVANSKLFPFQVKGVDHLARRNRAFLGDEMGLGKTVQVAAALDAGQPVLVICPNSLKINWCREVSKWSPTYKTEALSGRESFRWPVAGEMVSINYDILPAWLDKNVEQKAMKKAAEKLKDAKSEEIKNCELVIKEIEAEIASNEVKRAACPKNLVVVVDEAQYCKKHTSNRSQRVKAVCDGMALKVWALSGTPLDNKPLDLWGVLQHTGMAKEVFGTWSKFTKLYGAYKTRWGGWEFNTPSVEVPERLRRVMLRRLRAEVMPELPPKVWQNIEINDLPKELVARLDALQLELLESGFDCNVGEELDPDAPWSGEVERELPPFDKFSEIRALLAESRIPAMLETAERYEESETPLIIFSAHRAPIDTLKGREGWRVITGDTKPEERQEIVDAFQAGLLKGVGITIRAGGVGLTLTKASHVLFVDLDWVPSANAQAEDRLARIGQTAKCVQVMRMVSTHVLDRHVHDLLCSKIAMAYASVDAKAEVAIKEAEAKAEKARIFAENKRKADQKIIAAINPEMKALALSAMQMLAGMCDRAQMIDGCGFNKMDAGFGHALAGCASLSDKQALAAIKLARKYRRQLPQETVLGLGVQDQKKETASV